VSPCTKATFVGPGFTRKPPKYERFIRPSGLRQTKARGSLTTSTRPTLCSRSDGPSQSARLHEDLLYRLFML